MTLKPLWLALIVLFALPGYATLKNWDDYSKSEQEDTLIAIAHEQSRHSKYRLDCSGFVESVLLKIGHDVPEFTRLYDVHANGVRQIYEYVARSGTLFRSKIPKPGDLVFFSRTYDLNRDRKLNDPLTHIGIVTAVDKDGTITFMHVIQRKVQTDFMNLFKPNVYEESGKILNSYLRRAQQGSPTSALSSQLFDFFGSLNPV